MKRDQLNDLLKRFDDDELSEVEQKILFEYYEIFSEDSDVLAVKSEEEKALLKGSIQQLMQRNIEKGEAAIPVRNIRKWIAAAAIILTMVLTGVFYFNKAPQQLAIEKSLEKIKDENRIIFLPDGSKVILSAGSKLNYPSSFEGAKRREVYLNGQAFFDIKHNSKMPFVVHTEKLETIVLGTAFNIKALPGDQNIAVTVARGKVKVVDQASNKTLGVLNPNQQILYCKTKVTSELKIVDQDSVLVWKEKNLLLDNLTIGEAAELLEEKYNVKIKISDEAIRSQRFTTTFSMKESFENILKSICLFNDLDYEYDSIQSTALIHIKE